jgi:hypothetical protein
MDGGTGVRIQPYWRFDDLGALTAAEVTSGTYDVVIHAAAASDYHVAGVFTHHNGRFEDAAAGKVKSHHPELWLRPVPAPKLIDKVRTEWGFAGSRLREICRGLHQPRRLGETHRRHVGTVRSDVALSSVLSKA